MNELTETNNTEIINIIERLALDPNVNTDKMQQIIDMQTQIFDKNAQIEFNKAMVQCQSKMPKVITNKINKQTSSTYASLGRVIETVKPIYTKAGISLSFANKQASKPDYVCVTCEVMHKSGYTQHHEVEWPIDNKGMAGKTNKIEIHGIASTNTYAQRYLTVMIFNIAIDDFDNDGNGQVDDLVKLTDEQAESLHKLLIEVNADEEKFCKWQNVATLKDILNENYHRAIKALEDKR